MLKIVKMGQVASSEPEERWPTGRIIDWLAAASVSPIDMDTAYWSAVRLLYGRDTTEVWDAVTPLACHQEPRVRSVVPDVLRCLGGHQKPRLADTVALFRHMLDRGEQPCVIERIGLAFVDLDDVAALELMVPYADHPDDKVRSAVVHALLGRKERVAIDTLIGLSTDVSSYVREWATFGLGSLLGEPGDRDYVDLPAVREALVRALTDPDEGTRGEAAVGLAIRGDDRAVPVIKADLQAGAQVDMFAEAAEIVGTPELIALAEDWYRTHAR